MTDVVFCRQVQSIPEDLHWFCPRQGADDFEVYFPEDIQGRLQNEDDDSARARLKRVEDAISRKSLVFDSLQIFAFDGKDAAQYQQWLEDRLGAQMRCDICVREYHRGRRKFKEKLNE